MQYSEGEEHFQMCSHQNEVSAPSQQEPIYSVLGEAEARQFSMLVKSYKVINFLTHLLILTHLMGR